MPLDEARLAETREWVHKAALDLRAAEFDLTSEPPLTSDIVFHCQQLAEKSLKAFLTWHDQPFRKTHNLVEIGQQCTTIDPALEDTARRAATLTEYAWRFRYPGEPKEPSVSEAKKALALAREVYQAVLSRLPPEVQPR
ncbi:MAG: HEPN domain-containing protein [Chloroflexi bacterium]|nr:HEPN domain-containing protein [Chloroflexota bacterium]